MIFHSTPLQGAYVIDLEPFKDDRGLFARTFCEREFEQIHHEKKFVQMNHSLNKHKGTLRGLHYQKPPFAEIKLIRCIRGSVWDVLVDIRKESPTFMQHFGVELSEQNMRMIYIPKGFAHGFQTLEDDTALIYHHTEFYTPSSEGGLKYDDPALNIQWKMPPSVMSEKDQNYQPIATSFVGV